MIKESQEVDASGELGSAGRRDFIIKAGRFAAVTPPAVTLLLSTSLTSNAIASSGSGNGPPFGLPPGPPAGVPPGGGKGKGKGGSG